jgi:hypothetical protein
LWIWDLGFGIADFGKQRTEVPEDRRWEDGKVREGMNSACDELSRVEVGMRKSEIDMRKTEDSELGSGNKNQD